jgi:hypothetical protein
LPSLSSLLLRMQICQRIAHAMGGALTASSEGRDRGTTFTFTIPLRLPAAAEEQDGDSAADDVAMIHAPPPLLQTSSSTVALAFAAVTSAPTISVAATPPPQPVTPPNGGMVQDSLRGLRVMVAEDDKLCASLMQKVLARLQVAGTVVSDGVEAVALYKQGAWSGACACGASVAQMRALNSRAFLPALLSAWQRIHRLTSS